MNIQELIDQELFADAIEQITETRPVREYIDYYNGDHPILTDEDRADYFSGEGDNIKKVTRTRMILPYPKQIIATYVSMFFGRKMSIFNNSEGIDEEFDYFKSQWSDSLRYDSFNQKLCYQLGIESKVAELIYIDPETKDIKVLLLSKENGDTINAHFDDFGSLDAVLREYTSTQLVDGSLDEVNIVEIYTKKGLYKSIDDGSTFEFTKYTHGEKLPIIYWDQEFPEWNDVEDIITKQEKVHSQHSDVNKRVGNPNIVIDGEITKMPEIDQDVKIFNTKPVMVGEKPVKSSVNYLTAESAPESVRLEIERLDKYIAMGSWPDLSFFLHENLGADPSGTSIRLRMTQLYINMMNRYPLFTEMISRRISVLKYLMSFVKSNKINDLKIDFEFNSIIPVNVKEISETWSSAYISGTTSQKQAVMNNPINQSNPSVLQEIRDEEANKQTI